MRTYYVYILTNHTRRLYIGSTSNLHSRVEQHKRRAGNTFTARYLIDRLVHYEETNDPYAAVSRERALKKWPRNKKLGLIDQFNPEWRDLASELLTG